MSRRAFHSVFLTTAALFGLVTGWWGGAAALGASAGAQVSIPALPLREQLGPVPAPSERPATLTGSVAESLSPAQQAFDQVAGRLRGDYAGLSAVDRSVLIREYQARLQAVCEPQPRTCSAETAYPVIEASLTALGDAHTFLQWPDEYQDFVSSAVGGQRLQFGVKLAELDGERRLVIEVVPNSVADAAGLKRGDVLQTLDDQPYRYSAFTAARESGTPITLGLDRRGQRLSVRLTAGRSAAADPPRLSWVGKAASVALIRIPTFLSGGEVAALVHRQVAQARKQQAAAVVVDLRGNSGGSLLECDLAASAFVPQFERAAHSSAGETLTRVAGGERWDAGKLMGRVANAQFWGGPLAVLVDENSASCAEFFAYEVQHSGVGVVVGTPTAGVGNTATRVYPLTGGAGLQLTVLHYSKPTAQSATKAATKVGAGGLPYPLTVQPDIKVTGGEAARRALAQGRDLTLEAALNALPSK